MVSNVAPQWSTHSLPCISSGYRRVPLLIYCDLCGSELRRERPNFRGQHGAAAFNKGLGLVETTGQVLLLFTLFGETQEVKPTYVVSGGQEE